MKLKDTQTCQADGLGAQHRQTAGGGRRGQVGLPVAVALRRHARHLGRAHLRECTGAKYIPEVREPQKETVITIR